MQFIKAAKIKERRQVIFYANTDLNMFS